MNLNESPPISSNLHKSVKISVIICCYTMERLNDIHEALNSVLAQTLKPYEVILAVDHNQELFQSLQSPTSPDSRLKVVLNTGVQGLSETRNIGIRASTGDIVAFIDDDAVAEPDWLENLIKPFSQQSAVQSQSPQSLVPNLQTIGYRVVAVGGRAIPLWLSGSRPSWFPEELDWIVGCTYKGLPVKTLNLELRTIRNVAGCNMAFKKEVFGQIGFFESEMGGIKETPRGGEEAELCLRIKHKFPDSLILYQADAIIHHKVPSWRLNLKYLAQRSYNEGFYKAKVKKLRQPTPNMEHRTLNLERRTTNQTLSTESSYLRYLLFTSIPERFKRFYKKGSLSQAGAIIISIIATGAGYLIGKVNMVRFFKSGKTEKSGLEVVLNQLNALGIPSGLHTKKEKKLLWDLAKSEGADAIIEIGSFEGYSTIILAKGLKDPACVYAVDPHTGKLCESDENESSLRRDTWTRFNQNIQNAGVSQIVRPIRLKSEEAVLSWNNPIRLLWIDGSHRYEDVKKDFLLWHPYLLPGGVVVFHDCWIAGVRRVIVDLVVSNRLFGQFKFTPCCMFCATYLGEEHRHTPQRSFWRLVFWFRGIIEERHTLRRWLLHLLRRLS